MSQIRVLESDDFAVDYDRECDMYRIVYFEDYNFCYEYWLDAHKDKELSVNFPQIIGNITFYSKAELFEWVENQQKINERYQIKLTLPQPEVEKLMRDMFGSLNIGALDCNGMSEEEISSVVNE